MNLNLPLALASGFDTWDLPSRAERVPEHRMLYCTAAGPQLARLFYDLAFNASDEAILPRLQLDRLGVIQRSKALKRRRKRTGGYHGGQAYPLLHDGLSRPSLNRTGVLGPFVARDSKVWLRVRSIARLTPDAFTPWAAYEVLVLYIPA